MKKVVLVKEESRSPGSEGGAYGLFFEALKEVLEKGGAEVSVMSTVNEAWTVIRAGGVDALVLRGTRMLKDAEQMRAGYPNLRVILFAETFPKERVVVVEDGWFASETSLQRVVLG